MAASLQLPTWPTRKNNCDRNNGDRYQHPILAGKAESHEVLYEPVAHLALGYNQALTQALRLAGKRDPLNQ